MEDFQIRKMQLKSKMTMAKFELNFGDVISIPLGENLYGFGQVINSYDNKSGSFLIAIFDFKSETLKDVKLESICSSKPLFLGFTFDAKIYHGHWLLIGNYKKNIPLIKKPYFKLGTPPNDIYLVDISGEIITEITEEMFNRLTYKTEIAPIRYENALKAYYGLQEWIDEDYNKILYQQSINSNDIWMNSSSN